MHDHGPLDPAHRETIDLWVSDFFDRPASRDVAARVGPEAGSVLAAFLEGACHAGRAPADIEAHDVGHSLLDHVAHLTLSPEERSGVPDLVAAFLADLEDSGRLAEGHLLAAQVRVLAPTFKDRAQGRAPDLKRPGKKVGRNDPCPCGSGKKYKQCCLRTLG